MKELQVRLAQSNTTAKKYAVKILGKAKKYREFRHNLCLFAKEQPQDAKMAAAISEIPSNDLKCILDAEEIKPILVKKMWYLAKRIAIDMAVKFECDVTNLHGQACLFLLWAIYGYERDTIKFTTYFYHVIRRELQRYCLMQGSGITGNSYDLLDFKRQYIKASQELKDQDISPNFHNVAEHLKLEWEDKSSRKKTYGCYGIRW
jgi:DNA-directed RNA polymerase specialized sigma subunit